MYSPSNAQSAQGETSALFFVAPLPPAAGTESVRPPRTS